MSAGRDFVIARLGTARVSAQGALDAIDEALQLFLDTEDDKDGSGRSEMIDAADEYLGVASRLVQAAAERLADVDMEEGEPDVDSEEEEDEEDDEGEAA